MSERFPDEATRFTDQIDAANHIADLHNRNSERLARAKAAPEQVQNEDGTWPTTECLDCGEEIEPQRLALCKVLCIACQTHKEKQEATYGSRRY